MIGDCWLDDFMSELENVETPRSWLWWSLISAISASCGNNYYLRAFKGSVIYKPNLYVMLLGSSGLGKGYGINLAKLLVQRIEFTRVVAGRSSIQAIVTELSRTKSANGGPPMLDSRGFIVNGELSAAIISDVSALAILTDLYDGNYNPEWTNMLKMNDTREKLVNPYITALFGSSQAHFYDTIPQANIEGGYIGRNLIVYEEKRYKDLDLLDTAGTVEDVDDYTKDYLVPKYSKYLKEISERKGRMIYTETAKDTLNTWRHGWRKSQGDEKTGFYNRVPDHVLKVAMCICLSRYNNALVINEFDIQEAIERVTGLIYANKLTGAVTKSLDPLVTHSKTILDLLIKSDENKATRKQLLNRSYPYGLCDTSTLDKILDNLVEIGYVTKDRVPTSKGFDWMIKLAGEPLINYQKFLESQSKRR